MNEFVSYGLRKIINWIPSLLRRKLFPITEVREQIKIELRGNAPITPWMQENPYIDMWFEITNLSHLTVTLDRLFIEVWYGQPLFSAWTLKRYEIPASQTQKDIHHRHYLTEPQKAQVQAYQDRAIQDRFITITVHLTAYFESKIGMIEVVERIERRQGV